MMIEIALDFYKKKIHLKTTTDRSTVCLADITR